MEPVDDLDAFAEKLALYMKDVNIQKLNFRFHLSPDFPEWVVQPDKQHIFETHQLSEEEITYLKRTLEEKVTGKVRKRHNPVITPEDIKNAK